MGSTHRCTFAGNRRLNVSRASETSFENACKRVLAKLFGNRERSAIAEDAWVASTLQCSAISDDSLPTVARLSHARERAVKTIVSSQRSLALIEDAIASLDRAIYAVHLEAQPRPII